VKALNIAMLLAGAVPCIVQAQSPAPYPSRLVRVIVAGTPGGTSDAVGRALANGLAERWKSPVVVDNQSGASGAIAIGAAAKAAPDGYTLHSMGASTLVSLVVDGAAKRGINFKTAFSPITHLASQPYVFVIHPTVPATTVKELIAYAKANPGKLNFASFGKNTSSHLGMALFAEMAGIELNHVPYRGTNAILNDLMASRIQALLGGAMSSMPLVRSGKLRAIAVTSAKRSKLLPDIPAVAETLPGYSIDPWFGLVAPGGTPSGIISQVYKDSAQVISDPQLVARFASTGTELAPSASPAEFKSTLDAEVDRWEQFAAKHPASD
jgi:tripartite-type tricarboxylate transporter receptor subunit TctC